MPKRRHELLTDEPGTGAAVIRSMDESSSEARERSPKMSEVSECVSQLGNIIRKSISHLVKGMKQVIEVVSSVSFEIIQQFNPLFQNVNEWLDATDEFAFIYGWNDRTTAHVALRKLRGPAEKWYRGLPIINRTIHSKMRFTYRYKNYDELHSSK